jgi:hypothetical protein
LLFWLARGPRALLVQALGAATGKEKTKEKSK